MTDSRTLCQTNRKLRLPIRLVNVHEGYKEVSFDLIIGAGISIWEIESLWLAKLWTTDKSYSRHIEEKYVLKSNAEHYLILQWIDIDEDSDKIP